MGDKLLVSETGGLRQHAGGHGPSIGCGPESGARSAVPKHFVRAAGDFFQNELSKWRFCLIFVAYQLCTPFVHRPQKRFLMKEVRRALFCREAWQPSELLALRCR